jgi:hypothetical protein
MFKKTVSCTAKILQKQKIEFAVIYEGCGVYIFHIMNNADE